MPLYTALNMTARNGEGERRGTVVVQMVSRPLKVTKHTEVKSGWAETGTGTGTGRSMRTAVARRRCVVKTTNCQKCLPTYGVGDFDFPHSAHTHSHTHAHTHSRARSRTESGILLSHFRFIASF